MEIHLIGEVNEEMVQKVADVIKACPNDERLEISITSEGGSGYCALAIYEMLTTSTLIVKTIGVGIVMSAATLILAAGDVRAMTKETWLMVHDTKSTNKGDYHSHRVHTLQTAKEEEQWARLLADSSNLSAKMWRKLSEKTTYLTAKQCAKCRLIGEIL